MKVNFANPPHNNKHIMKPLHAKTLNPQPLTRLFLVEPFLDLDFP